MTPDNSPVQQMIINCYASRVHILESQLETICYDLAGCWLYGDWKAETASEKNLEQNMRTLNWWPITESELIERGKMIRERKREEKENYGKRN